MMPNIWHQPGNLRVGDQTSAPTGNLLPPGCVKQQNISSHSMPLMINFAGCTIKDFFSTPCKSGSYKAHAGGCYNVD